MGFTEGYRVFEICKFDDSGVARFGFDQALEFWELVLAGPITEGTPVVLMPPLVFKESAECFGFAILTEQAKILASYPVSNDAIEDVRLFTADTFHNSHLTTRRSISEVSIEDGV